MKKPCIFDALRQNLDVNLGLSDYFALLDVLQAGWGFDAQTGAISQEKLLELCQLLWLKPNQSPHLFVHFFENAYQLLEKPNQKSQNQTKKEEDTPHDPIAKNDSNIKTTPQTTQKEKLPEPQKEEKTIPSEGTEKVKLQVSLGKTEAGQKGLSDQEAVEKNRTFLFSEDYFPIDERRIIQTFRLLPSRRKANLSSQIDVDTTLLEISKKGFLQQVHYAKQQKISNKVFWLSDHEGSMIAFEALDTLFFNGLKIAFSDYNQVQQNVEQFYFHNIPQAYLYQNKAHTSYFSTQTFIKNNSASSNLLFIFSDAGAARSNNSNARVRATIKSLIQWKALTQKIVWLNPLPAYRWKGTSAERIARFVNMYEANEKGLTEAIRFLSGKE